MTHGLRFQVLVLPNQPWSEIRRRFLLVEELGFDVAATADHLVDWSNPGNTWFESWSLLAAMAVETSRIRLMTCVSQIPLRNPTTLAHLAVTLDHISNGRAELGIGTGLIGDPSPVMMGVGDWGGRERVERFGEYIEIVTRLLANEVTTFEGGYYRAEGALIHPRSIQTPRIPLTIAALGPRMVKNAAKFADIWNSLSFAENFADQLEETKQRVALFDAACGEVGRDPDEVKRSFTFFDPTARKSGGRLAYYESEEVFVERVDAVVQMGMTDISIYYPLVEEQVLMFEHLARVVIPQLKAGHS